MDKLGVYLALVCDVYCDFVTFPFGILGQVWYLIVSIPDPCCLSYFHANQTSMCLYPHHLLWSLSWGNFVEGFQSFFSRRTFFLVQNPQFYIY